MVLPQRDLRSDGNNEDIRAKKMKTFVNKLIANYAESVRAQIPQGKRFAYLPVM